MKQHTGWFILGTLIFYLSSLMFPGLLIAVAILAWLVPILRWQDFGKSAQNQARILLSLGIIAIAFTAFKGILPDWRQIFMVNLPLLAMNVAVAFLSLTNPGCSQNDLPKGKLAAATTSIGANLIGSVINLSVLFVFGDRLQRGGKLTGAQRVILCRSFCAAAWWSPFFIATGVALTYAPGMHWQETIKPGILMCIIALCYTVIEVTVFRKKTEFRGYPLKVESLIVPLFLAASVIIVHSIQNKISILNIICVVAPLGALAFMKGAPKRAILRDFIAHRILPTSSQFLLFLAAGVFSTGIKSITLVYPALFSLEGLTFTPLMFATILGVLIVVGMCGVHPLVGISIVSPLLLPLNPDLSRLGFLFLSTWAISTGSSPLSAVGLVLVSRYQAPPQAILSNNWHYALAMWAISSLVNAVYF